MRLLIASLLTVIAFASDDADFTSRFGFIPSTPRGIFKQQPLDFTPEQNSERAGICTNEPQIPSSQPPPSPKGSWLGWGGDIYNNHWAASDASVGASNVASLRLVCQKKYSPGVSAAPLVQDGIAYFPTWSGLLVALEYVNCHILWQTNVTEIISKYKPVENIYASIVLSVSRTTPVMDGDVLYVGTQANALLLAIEKSNGKLIDALQISHHPVAIITQSPTFYGGRVFVGASSNEEGAADEIPGYKCCTFIGTMNAVALMHGRLRLLWTQYMIPPGLNFSGAAIWGSQPAIDPIRDQVFIATGNSYSIPLEYEACQNQTANITVIKQGNTTDPCLPRTVYQESVLAFDLATGRINWVRQLSPLDAWNIACLEGGNPGACPPNPGPDADFGIAPTFVLGSENTPYGQDIIIVGQKNGNLYALSAQAGMLLWVTPTSPDGVEGGLIWGLAVDAAAVYYTAVNSLRVPYTLLNGQNISNSAFGAASLQTGAILWETAAPRNTTSLVPPSVVNDVVLTGITGNYAPGSLFPVGSGSFLPLNKYTGKIIEEFPLDSYFQGAFAAVHDYVMFGTGYWNPKTDGTFNVWKC